MKKIQTFIFIHNQNILLDFIKIGKFNEIEDKKFVFLGSGDVSQISHLDNLIVAREQPINIEEYPKLTSFTGWYCLWKNNLIDSEYLNLFEYDINLLNGFNETINREINSYDILGYIPLNVHDNLFIKMDVYSGGLLNGVKEVYGIDAVEFLNNFELNKNCSVTSNHTFSKKMFEKYMIWVDPILPYFKDLHMAGHQIERSISLFYLLNNIKKTAIIDKVLEHYQLDSHKTQGFNQEQCKQKYNNLLK